MYKKIINSDKNLFFYLIIFRFNTMTIFTNVQTKAKSQIK